MTLKSRLKAALGAFMAIDKRHGTDGGTGKDRELSKGPHELSDVHHQPSFPMPEEIDININETETIKLDRASRDLLRELIHVLRELIVKLAPHPAVSSTLTLIAKGVPLSMPLQVALTDVPGVAVYSEFDQPGGLGNKVPAVGLVQYASDTPAVATVDPNTGQLAYVAAGTAVISASDGGNLPASDILTVTGPVTPPPGQPVSSTMTLVPGAAPVTSVSPAAAFRKV